MKVDGIEIVIESDAKKACAELDKMIAKLNQVGVAMRSTGSTSGVSGGVKSATNSLKSYTSTANKATKSTFSLAAAFGRFYASCFLAIRGIKALGKSIGSSMDYVETYNYFNVITDKIGTEFGSAWKENGYSSAEEYSKSFRDRLNEVTQKMTGYKIGEEGGLYSTDSIGLGLDPEKLMSYQANIASITNAVGLVGETSTNTSKALSMLSADLSSLKNQDLESVMTNLQSGLIGQSRALYKYGIDITNTTLQEYALANGISKKVSEMTQAEKMQLRLIAILDQSKVAYGDMANTIGGVANQYRLFKQQVSNLARTIGSLFIPVLQKVLPYINGFIIALQRMFSWIGGLLGIEWSSLMDGISTGYTDTGLDALNDDAEDVTKSLDDANKAASKLKKTVHGYDELHIATDNSSGSDSSKIGGSGGIDLSGQIADALGDYESVWNEALSKMENKAQKIADNIASFFKKIWTAIEPFRTAVKSLWDEGLSKFADFSFTALEDFYNEFLIPIGEWAFGTDGKGLTKFVDVLNRMLNEIKWDDLNASLKTLFQKLEPFAEDIGGGLIWLWDKVLSKFATFTVNQTLISTLDALSASLESIDIIITKLKPTFNWLWDNLGADYQEGYLDGLGDTIDDLLDPFTSLRDLLKDFSWDNFLEYAKDVYDFVQVLTNPFGAASKGIISGSNKIIDKSKVKDDSENYGGGGGYTNRDQNELSKIIDDMNAKLKAWQANSRTIRTEESDDWSVWFANIGTKFDTGWNNIVTWWNTSIVGWWDTSVSPWFTADRWKTLWENVKTAFSTKWNEITVWWQSTGVYKWFEESVAPWFTIEKWQGIWDNVKKSFSTKWGEIVEWWKTSGVVKWWNDNVAPWFTKEKWTFSGIKDGLESAFNVAVKGIKGIWNDLATWLNETLHIKFDGITLPNGENILGFDVQLGKLPILPTYQTGGFPEDGLFMANHNELLGKFSNGKTAVANNEQIIEGIKNGVTEAMMNVLMSMDSSNNQQTGETHVHVHFGSEELGVASFKAIKDGQRRGLIPQFQ